MSIKQARLIVLSLSSWNSIKCWLMFIMPKFRCVYCPVVVNFKFDYLLLAYVYHLEIQLSIVLCL